VQGGYGALFAVMVQVLSSITRVAVQVRSEPRVYPRLQIWWWTLAQCRAVPRRSQKIITVQDFNCEQMRVSGCNGHYEIVLGAGAKAKTVTNSLPLLSVLAVGF
jgi:hypothetical protein